MRQIIRCVGNYMKVMPRSNFGAPWADACNEDSFAHAFANTYDKKYAALHSCSSKLNRIMAHEVPVNGFGIPDLVTVSWKPSVKKRFSLQNLSELYPTVRAFEFKMSAYRRGLMQAYRYRFFADVSILVIPASKLPIAAQFIHTFHALNVGLWGFNETTKTVSAIFTPRPRKPDDQKHREIVISRVFRVAEQNLPSS